MLVLYNGINVLNQMHLTIILKSPSSLRFFYVIETVADSQILILVMIAALG